MLQGTLEQALGADPAPPFQLSPLGTRRTIVLSGMWVRRGARGPGAARGGLLRSALLPLKGFRWCPALP